MPQPSASTVFLGLGLIAFIMWQKTSDFETRVKAIYARAVHHREQARRRGETEPPFTKTSWMGRVLAIQEAACRHVIGMVEGYDALQSVKGEEGFAFALRGVFGELAPLPEIIVDLHDADKIAETRARASFQFSEMGLQTVDIGGFILTPENMARVEAVHESIEVTFKIIDEAVHLTLESIAQIEMKMAEAWEQISGRAGES